MFNILLQVLDDGRITDSQGRTVDFKNTVIILTSNLGSDAILEGIDDAGSLMDSARAEVERRLQRQFRPEFLNRLDEIVFYTPLTKAQITSIMELMLAKLSERLADRQITVELTDRARDHIVENGDTVHCDARGRKVGESRQGLFGSTKHYDSKGRVIGSSAHGLFGNTKHYDKKGRKTGESDIGLFGDIHTKWK